MALWADKTSTVRPQMTNAKGENAQQYTPDIQDGAYSKTIDPIKEQVMDVAKDNPRAASILRTRLEKSEAALKSDITTNVVRQTYLTNVANYDGQIDAIQKNIPTYLSPSSIMSHREQMVDLVKQRLAVVGKEATTDDQVDRFTQMYDSQVIKNYTAKGDIKGATAYAKRIQEDGGAISPITEKNVYQASNRQAAESWYATKAIQYVTSDGKPDINKIMNSLPPNLTQDQKDIWTKTIMPKYRLDLTKVNGDHSNQMTAFKNALSNNPDNATIQRLAKQLSWNGASYDAMLKLASKPDHGDLILTFAGKGKNLEAVHRNVYNGIMEGRVTQDDLFKLFNDGVLDKDSYTTGQKLLDSNNKAGINATKANFSRSVHREALDAYGGDADKATEFSNEFYKHLSDNPNASVQDLRKYVDDNLKPAMKDPSNFWENLRKEETSGQDGEAEQTLRATIGAGTLEGISSYLSKQGNQNEIDPTQDLQDYIHELGVTMDDMAVGTPINNAINSILEWNEANPNKYYAPSPENVLKIINAKNEDGTPTYPEGLAF